MRVWILQGFGSKGWGLGLEFGRVPICGVSGNQRPFNGWSLSIVSSACSMSLFQITTWSSTWGHSTLGGWGTKAPFFVNSP